MSPPVASPRKIFIGTGVFVDDIWTDFMATVWKIVGIIALLALPAIALVGLVGFGVSRSVRGVGAAMQSLADGNLAIELPEVERADEGPANTTVSTVRAGRGYS